tara:strand:- start:11944 stop:15759 length:3816 start_codon:yes stop_codon:yes gene_type:complete
MEKIYRSKIDLRVLGKEIKFNFFISGNISNTTNQQEVISKRNSFNFVYKTTYPVDIIVKVENNVQRTFLYFDEKLLEFNNFNNLISTLNTPLILEIFRNSKGNLGFEKIISAQAGAFLSHPNYFNTSLTEGSIKPFGKIIAGKSHAIQMIIPGIRLRKNIINTISFDMDIFVEKCEQYVHSLGFKVNLDKTGIIKGDVITINPVKQITTQPTDIKLKTTYLTLKPKDLNNGEIMYDYKKQLTPQNCEPETLELLSSNVYTVENPLDTNVDLTDLNLSTENKIQIPYNISRFVEDNEIKETNKIFKNGKYIYPLNWVNEMQNNEVFADADTCYSLKFATKTQLQSFTDKLKSQQIGSVETYLTTNNVGDSEIKPRTYSRLSQWVERSSLNSFNDVRFSYDTYGDINSIIICPNKECAVGPEKFGTEKGLYTSGNEYNLSNGENYVGYYHVHPEKGAMVGAEHTDKSHDSLKALYTIAPISANSVNDFCFSTYNKKSNYEVYSGFTVTSEDSNEINNTYDIQLSAASFSAETIIPISNIETQTKMSLIGDPTLQYRPYTFSEAYGRNNGALIFNESDVDNYLTYSAITSGVYRFTYKAYLNIEYTDTKWCQYLETAYPSGFTKTYPSNDYEIKRLINTSLIQAGMGEKETVGVDTNFVFNSGEKYRNCYSGREKYVCTDTPTNTGIINFNFKASIIKGSSTGGTGTTLTQFQVLRSRESDGLANDYLTLDVDNNDLTTGGMNSCVLSSMTSSTIFHKQIPVTLDTGFINLISGQTIQLRYETDWTSTSKGNFYDLSDGATAIRINLGHKLDMSGRTLEAPYYRGVKASTSVVDKKLFFDSTKESLPFELKVGGATKTVRLNGSLYLSDSECGNIKTPYVDNTNFSKLTFLDSTAPESKLVWDVTTEIPTNRWQGMIESNTIKDYVLSTKSNYSMTAMKDNGVFCFYIPTYNSDEYGGKCDFNFPQLTQSYVIHNKFKNYYGNLLEHFIVVTPDCGFHRPCYGTKPKSTYDIIHKTTPADWKVVNLNRKLNIKGKEVNIVSAFSQYKPEPETNESKTKCKYYCKCGQELSSTLKLDPIYGITNIFNDLQVNECGDCIMKAQEYCFSLNKKCEAKLMGDCAKENVYIQQVINNLQPSITPYTSTLYVTKNGDGSKPKSQGGGVEPSGGEPRGKPQIPTEVQTRYSCKDGLCFKDSKGRYETFEDCVNNCTNIVRPPKNTPIYESNDTEEKKEKVGGYEITEGIADSVSGLCSKGQYWCESMGRCISDKEPCKGIK